MNMLLSLEPLVCFESITNGNKFLKITSGGAHQTQSAYDVLLHDGWPAPCGHLLIPYAYENHVQFCGYDDVVDMYVS